MMLNNWIAVDLDGTILPISDAGIEAPLLPPFSGAADVLLFLHQLGYKICIHTARPVDQTKVIMKHLTSHRIPFDEINMGCAPWETTKPLADVYIDDRAYRFKNWRLLLPEVLVQLDSQRRELNKGALLPYIGGKASELLGFPKEWPFMVLLVVFIRECLDSWLKSKLSNEGASAHLKNLKESLSRLELIT